MRQISSRYCFRCTYIDLVVKDLRNLKKGKDGQDGSEEVCANVEANKDGRRKHRNRPPVEFLIVKVPNLQRSQSRVQKVGAHELQGAKTGKQGETKSAKRLPQDPELEW